MFGKEEKVGPLKPIDEKTVNEAREIARMIFENCNSSEQQNDFIKLICQQLVDIRDEKINEFTVKVAEFQEQIESDQTVMHNIRNANESLMDFVHPPKLAQKTPTEG